MLACSRKGHCRVKTRSKEHKYGRPVRAALLTLSIAIPAHFIILDQVFSRAVARAEVMGFSPSKVAQRAIPEWQAEPHTCGLHCLRSLYRAHGLNPDKHALRFRLGVDRPAIPAISSTEGALQPDICRVLAQDGFTVEQLDLESDNSADSLTRHLGNSWKALALIRKPSNGGLHWVVIQDKGSRQIEVVDSQFRSPYEENTTAFLGEKAISVFLVTPGTPNIKKTIKEAHRIGVMAMKETPAKIRNLEQSH